MLAHQRNGSNMQTNRWLQTLIVLLVIIAALFLAGQIWLFLVQFTNIILLFVLSWLLAFMLRPVARWLTGNGLPYTLSVAIVYVILALLFAIGGYALVPVISQQVMDLSQNYNSYLNDLDSLVRASQQTIVSWGIQPVDIDAFLSQIRGQAQSIGMGVLNNTISVLQSIASLVLQLILVFLLSFYFMKDGEKIFDNMLHLLPPRWTDEAQLIAKSIEKSFGGFIRGQVVFALVYGVLTALVMLFFRLDYIVIASIVAGLCMIIPLIGNFLAFAPPLLVCLVQQPQNWGWVLLALFVVQSIQMNVVGPRIMSQAIGIHPLYVVAAMLVGGQVAGFWGALFGIPIAGAINLIGRPMMRRLRYQSPIYQEVDGVHLTTRHFATGPLRAAMAEGVASGSITGQPPPEAVDETIPHTVMSERPTPAYGNHTSLPAWEDDVPLPRETPITGRVWRLLLLVLARLYGWIGQRAHARSPRR